MRNLVRWSAVLTAMLLVLAACQSTGSSSPSEAASVAASAAVDPTAVCAADPYKCVEVAPGDPITIGTELVITTADADLGQDSQYGAHVAGVLKNAAGGIDGHQIAWDDQDDQCSAEGGTTATRLLVADPTIAAIIGTSCSSAGVPGSQIASAAGVMMVSPSNTAPSLTAPATHNLFYARTAHNDKVQGAAMAKFACEVLKVKKAATVNDGSPYSSQLQQVFADEFVKQCAGVITAQDAVAPTDTDFRTVLATLAATKPDLIYYPIFTAGGAGMTVQARENPDLANVKLAGADGMQSQNFLKVAGAAADGLYSSGPDLNFAGSLYKDTFLPEYYKLCKCTKTLSVFHAHAFDAANIVFAAIEKVALKGSDGTLFIPRTALKNAVFATSGFAGITGVLTCNADGDCANPKIAVSLIKGGTYSQIWP